ncbi:hypothetical protein, conserved [Babesia ovata]|uniref:Uncharacterized protein n=1 Tax=Babesia ovata TaxID=189622 RepID=A0A2H6KA64_9APIC|nr:uncharacterized protein BOVATA_013730 [Babesia ovata]GBE59880.1 hypothetical protein, conserved [Babesia ovata]
MAYHALTEPPRNVKECMDWLIALKGKDPGKNLKALGEAVYKFLADKPVGKMQVPALEKVKHVSEVFLRRQCIRDQPFVRELLQRFNKPMDKNPKKFGNVIKGVEESDYKNVVKARGKVVDAYQKFSDEIKHPKHYMSAYSSKDTWDASCAQDLEACAVVLVGITPMLYAGIRSLRDASHDETYSWMSLKKKKNLGKVLETVGYKEPECRAGMSGSDVLKVFRVMDKEALDIIYDFAAFQAFYWALIL